MGFWLNRNGKNEAGSSGWLKRNVELFGVSFFIRHEENCFLACGAWAVYAWSAREPGGSSVLVRAKPESNRPGPASGNDQTLERESEDSVPNEDPSEEVDPSTEDDPAAEEDEAA